LELFTLLWPTLAEIFYKDFSEDQKFSRIGFVLTAARTLLAKLGTTVSQAYFALHKTLHQVQKF
jgi:hypothetical protein